MASIQEISLILTILLRISKTLNKIPKNIRWGFSSNDNSTSEAPFQILNIGNGNKISLKKYVIIISKLLKKKVKIKHLPFQDGDIKETLSDINETKKYLNFKPKTNINDGIKKFIDWYRKYHKV